MTTIQKTSIKKSSVLFLQAVIVLLGIGVLAFMLIEPRFEGRNAHATLMQVYSNDPFLAYAYAASVAFFVALYNAFKLLRFVGRGEVFSQNAVFALRAIKRCGLCLVGFIILPLAYLSIVRPGDDIAGGVAMGLFILLGSSVVATAAAVFEKTLQSAVDLKAENDLTV